MVGDFEPLTNLEKKITLKLMKWGWFPFTTVLQFWGRQLEMSCRKSWKNGFLQIAKWAWTLYHPEWLRAQVLILDWWHSKNHHPFGKQIENNLPIFTTTSDDQETGIPPAVKRQVSIDPGRASAGTIALHLPVDPQWLHVPSGAIVAQGTQVVEELFEHPFLLEIGPY